MRTRIARGEVGGTRWETAVREPAGPLRPYVRDLSGYAERTTTPLVRTELPGPTVVVILEIGPPIAVGGTRYRGGFVAGVDDAVTVTRHEGYQRGIQVNLTPIGARLLFGVPLVELARRVVPFNELVGREHREMAQRLAELPTWEQRLDVVEALLLTRIVEARLDTRIVAHAVSRIEASGGNVDLRALAAELGYSQKHVIALFHDQIGFAPKLLARLVRFQRLVAQIRSGVPASWAQLALELGYYDQSHLVRDVKHFTGLTPTEARESLFVPWPTSG